MKKKVLTFVLMLLSALLLVGCSLKGQISGSYTSEGQLPKNYLENNKLAVLDPIFTGYSEALEITGYDGVSGGPVRSYLRVSKIINGETKYGIYSLDKQKEILPAIYLSIDFQQETYYNEKTNLTYTMFFAKLYEDEKISLYSLTEDDFLVRSDNFLSLDLDVDWTGVKNYETITKIKSDGKVEIITNLASLDKDNKITRTVITEEGKGDFISEPDRITFPNVPKLKDYSYDVRAYKIDGYKGSKQVFSVGIPNLPSTYTFMVDKYLFIQTKTELAYDATKYSYFDNGDKILLNTSRIDLTNGNVKEYKNFEYVFRAVASKKDKDDNLTLIRAFATKISNQVLLDENTLLFDSNLKLLLNLTQKDYTDTFRKLGKDLYLNNNSLVINSKHEIVLNLQDYADISPLIEHGLISLRSGARYGLIKNNGEIVVPFMYVQPFKFFNDKAYNTSSIDGKRYLIDPDGSVRQIIDDNELYYRDGLFSNTSASGTVYKNYLGKTLITVADNETMTMSVDYYHNHTGQKIGLVVVVRNDDTNKNKIYIVK